MDGVMVMGAVIGVAIWVMLWMEVMTASLGFTTGGYGIGNAARKANKSHVWESVGF
jgi:hypothetical protein